MSVSLECLNPDCQNQLANLVEDDRTGDMVCGRFLMFTTSTIPTTTQKEEEETSGSGFGRGFGRVLLSC